LKGTPFRKEEERRGGLGEEKKSLLLGGSTTIKEYSFLIKEKANGENHRLGVFLVCTPPVGD